MDALLHDLRSAIRALRRAPGFTLGAVLTLALGMTAAIALFSVLDAVLLRPLPYREADRLVDVAIVNRTTGADAAVSLPNVEDWRAQATSLVAMAAWPTVGLQGLILTGEGEPEELRTGYVTPGFFKLLGIGAAVGRPFGEEAVAGADRVVVLSDPLWRERFGADPSVVGRRVLMSGQPFTVVGVAPPDLRVPSADTRIWVPLTVVDTSRAPYQLRGNAFFRAVGRLAPGAAPAGAQAEIGTILRRTATVDRDAIAQGDRVRVRPFRAVAVGEARRTLWLAFGAVAVVLVLTCANVAGLLVARGVRRQQEFGIRRALGASGGAVARGVLVEGLLLAGSAGLAGLLGSRYAVAVLVRLADAHIPAVAAIRVDARVAVFAVVLGGAVTLLCAAAPAWWAGRQDVRTMLGGVRAIGGDRAQRGILDLVVAAQVAAAVLLTVGAGLFLGSLRRLHEVPLGYQPERVAVAEFVIPSAFYPEQPVYLARHALILDEVRRIPGVEAAATIQSTPGTGILETTTARPPDAQSAERDVSAAWRTVSPGYFAVAGIQRLAGRDFTDADRRESPPVSIIDRSLALAVFGAVDVVGRQFEVDGTTAEIVGVVDDVRHAGPAGPTRPTVYRPLAQGPRRRVALLARATGDPAALLPALRAAIRAADPQQPIGRLDTHQAVLGATIAQPRFLLAVLGLFGSAALVLAALGTFGLVAYRTALRRREMGIRLALGGRWAGIVSVVLRQGLRLVALGAAVGLAGAVVLGRLLAGALYGVSPYHLPTYAAAAGCAMLTGLAACWLPAARAARVAPAEVLRHE